MAKEVALLGGGCFWCIEAVFAELQGVERVVSGYAGGHVENPSYEQVCGKKTGHVEVVRIEFDDQQLDFATVLQVFFTIHDPTTRDRQGNDVGPQYRSAIFCQSPEQRQTAERLIAQIDASAEHGSPVVTEVAEDARFYAAEGYHQQYFALHGHEPYCAYVVAPKVAKFRRKFAARLKAR